MEEILEKLKIIEDEIANVKTRINDVGRYPSGKIPIGSIICKN